jgi:hypothetical protein
MSMSILPLLRVATLMLLAEASAPVGMTSKGAATRGHPTQPSTTHASKVEEDMTSASDTGSRTGSGTSLPRLAVRGRGLVQVDGAGSGDTPFFWAADTAWNMLIKANASEAHEYFAQRRAQVREAMHGIALSVKALHDVHAPTD